MSEKAGAFHELHQKRLFLEGQLAIRKEVLKHDLREIQNELEPTLSVVKVVSQILVPDRQPNGLVQAGSSIFAGWAGNKLFRHNRLLRLISPIVLNKTFLAVATQSLQWIRNKVRMHR